MKKNEFIDNVYCVELGTDIKEFFKAKNIELLKKSCESYSAPLDSNGNPIKPSVLQGMEYRPDKIAAYYLGDETLGWVISITNGFENGIRDYYLGRELKIPDLSYVAGVMN